MPLRLNRREILIGGAAALTGLALGFISSNFLTRVSPVTATLTERLYSTKCLTILETTSLTETKTLTKTEMRTKTITETETEKRTITETYTHPYKREFPKMTEKAKIRIWSFYYPWYSSRENWLKYCIQTPLLGEYDSGDDLVISKHIDWATGHGIEAFFISWWGVGKREDINLKKFLRNSLSEDIKFAILYETLKENPPFQESSVLSDFEYFEEKFFADKRYLKINGKPVVFFYLARAYPEDAAKIMNALRKNHEAFLIGDVVYWQDPKKEKPLISVFDAVTAYNMHTSVQSILDNYTALLDNKYYEWCKVCDEVGVDFIPQVTPGFNDSKYPGRTNLPLPRSPDLFRTQFDIAKKYMSSDTIFVTSFNEWYENTQVEPSREDYFVYLQIIRENAE